MGVRSSLFLLGLVLSIGVAPSCNIDTCEGGNCSEGETSGESRDRECATYCARLSLCEAPQSANFEDCVSVCQQRFREDARKWPSSACAPSTATAAIDRRALSGGSRGRRRQRGKHRRIAHRRQRRFRRRRGWQCWRQRWFEWDRQLREWRSLRRREWQLRCGTADGLHA